MKKFLSFLVCAFVSFTSFAASANFSASDSKDIELEETPLPPLQPIKDRPRTISYFLKAYYDDQQDIAEIQHDNLGEADFYVLDESGQVVSQASTYSNTYSVEMIDIPSVAGVYTLVIDSESVYAYGYIVVN